MSNSARYTDLPLPTLVLTLRVRIPSDVPKPSAKPGRAER
jgi:hypothetical protein